MSIYVGNLSYDVTQDDLSEVFSEYGTVKRVQLPTDRETGRPRGFGFVEMATDEEEQKATLVLTRDTNILLVLVVRSYCASCFTQPAKATLLAKCTSCAESRSLGLPHSGNRVT